MTFTLTSFIFRRKSISTGLLHTLKILLTSWSRVLLKTLIVALLSKISQPFMVLGIFYCVYHRSIFLINPLISHSHQVTIQSISILSSHLHLFLEHSFPSGFSTKTFYAFLISHVRSVCSAHISHLNLAILIISAKE
jgi:hypothetical protein